MDVFGFLNLNELALGLSHLSMFPCFDTAHYIISVMSLREQPGALEVSQRSPFACWFSSMLYCFGGAVLSALMMADAPIAPLSNTTNLLLASLMWYLVFYCPLDAVYSLASVLPVRLVLTAMKEVTRTWKVLGGVTQAGRKYKDGLFVMIAVGWAKGAGGGLLSNFEQLVRGVWKPETNELLKMSYPTKVTLLGSVVFSLHQCRLLPIQTHQLIFIYTLFIVTNKTRMMLLGSSSYPFSAVETLLYKTLFVRPLTFSPLTDPSQSCRAAPNHNKPNAQDQKPSDTNEPDQTSPKDAETTKKTD
ncbi:trimeric intracellular cation channel type B-like isoform X2 [Sinocyclocheilus grahami]|uniref:Transmembrane protein 38B n=1 Tax=Sinocyclocheilus grahami TaxID=75366 RepID=A0A672LD70_SINGR|nr:PREDICTED: trimeric intracellular cation channel type B-like isoform X1 [Sinocyclocheilus grahami]XP_016109177.1 PREDICTED: trimeric intracellular cation channel type B-like isoform X2 [Sinocyclocheilus grahami]